MALSSLPGILARVGGADHSCERGLIGSAAAAYHFPDLHPPRTTAAFASVDDVGIVERAALGLP
jgi:hypothetical protein